MHIIVLLCRWIKYYELILYVGVSSCKILLLLYILEGVRLVYNIILYKLVYSTTRTSSYYSRSISIY